MQSSPGALECDQQVGVRLISHRQQAALWRHLHCGFISCCLRPTQNEEMQTSQSPEAADRSRRRPKRPYACGQPTPSRYTIIYVSVPIPTYYSRRPGGAKLSLSSREGLPNLAFDHFASTLPLFAASLACAPPRRSEPWRVNHRLLLSQIEQQTSFAAPLATASACVPRTPVSSVVRARARQSVAKGISLWLGRSSLCGGAEPHIGPGSFI